MAIMSFLIQKDEITAYDVELLTLRQVINKNHLYQYTEISINEMENIIESHKNDIPVGTIEFVKKFLFLAYGINRMPPIEIPVCLRKEKFLKRKYEILPGNEVPEKGYFFIKNASQLKDFSYLGNIENIPRGKNPYNGPEIIPQNFYVISEPKNIITEYRIFVHNEKIKACQYYDGDPLVFPTEKDVALIREMVLRWSLDPMHPKAYALDVAIIEDVQKELMLIETCPFVSVGTYGFEDNSLPSMYKDGFEWYVKFANIFKV